jgi:hypothetical protein
MKHLITYKLYSPLFEKLTLIEDDVELIYQKYFQKDIEEIEKTSKVKLEMFERSYSDTGILISDESKRGHELTPCKIFINQGANAYAPSNQSIYISINLSAFNFVIDCGGDLKEAANNLPENQRTSFLREFTKEKIKGSIHHELTHWLDDVFHNQHISKRIKKQQLAGTRDIRGKSVNAEKFEIQAQIHNIKQLYNSFSETWNEMTFKQMLSLSPALNGVYNQLSGKELLQWKRDLKTRMSREDLLGRNMRD